MAIALIVLAIGSVAAGWIGVPHALGGHNQLHAWLEPAFEPPAGAATLGSRRAAAGGEAAAESHDRLELVLMGVSTLIAVAGIWFAYQVWIRKRSIAENAARELRADPSAVVEQVLTWTRSTTLPSCSPYMPCRAKALWRGFDVKVIDGAVNGAATIVDSSATLLRRLQTGSVRTYAGSLFVGVVAILAYYLWL